MNFINVDKKSITHACSRFNFVISDFLNIGCCIYDQNDHSEWPDSIFFGLASLILYLDGIVLLRKLVIGRVNKGFEDRQG